MHIPKGPSQPSAYARPIAGFPRARDAFEAYLRALGPWHDRVVLLPAYIGWSPREGSGVLDPIQHLGLSHAFYSLDSDLHIDVSSVRQCLTQHSVGLLVIIHYFGFLDPAYEEVVDLARSSGVRVLEDEAHAMLTDLMTGTCGRLGDAAIYSLHKLLPTRTGGALVLNSGHGLRALDEGSHSLDSLWSYDLLGISTKRQENYVYLMRALEVLSEDLAVLRTPSSEVPQSLPVVVRSVDRNLLYSLMNEAGYGCVSLYHTLVGEIDASDFPRSHYLSKRILNLPIHQEADVSDLDRMVGFLADSIARLRMEA